MSLHSYFKFYQLHKLVMSSIWLLAVHPPSAAAVAFFLALVLWLLHLTEYYKSEQDLLATGKKLQVTGAEKCVKEELMLFWHLTCCLIGKYVGFILIVSKSFGSWGFVCCCFVVWVFFWLGFWFWFWFLFFFFFSFIAHKVCLMWGLWQLLEKNIL